MKYDPCVWRYDNLHGWSPRRIAAAKKAVAKELAWVASERDKLALFPELAAEILPDYTTEEERMAMMDQRELRLTREFRSRAAAGWKEVRTLYFSLPPLRRSGVRRLWDAGIYPHSSSYLHELIRHGTKPGCSPWTYLRKRRLCWLWARGLLERPDKTTRLAITSSFSTLGPVPAVRLAHQKLHRKRRHHANAQLYL